MNNRKLAEASACQLLRWLYYCRDSVADRLLFCDSGRTSEFQAQDIGLDLKSFLEQPAQPFCRAVNLGDFATDRLLYRTASHALHIRHELRVGRRTFDHERNASTLSFT